VTPLLELPKTGWGFDGEVLRLAQRNDALLYARYPRVLAHPLARKVRTLLELHSGLAAGDRRRVESGLAHGSLQGVIVISAALRDHMLSFSELKRFADRFLVAHDAVDGERFAGLVAPLDLEQIGYVGGLFQGKGMEQIARIVDLRPQLSFQVFGGRKTEVQYWRRQVVHLRNLKLWGHVCPAQVPSCMRRFGIALLPNQPVVRLPNGDDIGRFTSPMKLFEYMAAGRAIIASDLPGLREVLHHEVNCLLAPHDDAPAWARAIDRLRSQPQLAAQLAARARWEADRYYSYRNRFRTILNRFAPTG
jgi:glycosyltransferase involved in cell wall biosynthesis